ncbi:MAG: DUF5819 family protein [Aeromicrobium sp.]|uniref:DUF5819 family protein n=1 Tax=Aeromicrobium sp. TaxID=1871063 RepID=UPI0039E357EE
MPAASSTEVSVTRWQSGVMLTAAVAVVLHSVIVGLWLSPSSPIRESVGENALASYINPYFRQSPTTIDPALQRADEALKVRATVLNDTGEEIVTEWIDVTGAQLGASGLASTRVARSARALATNLNVALYSMPDKVREAVGEDMADDEGQNRRQELHKAGATRYDSRVFFANWTMATQFATLYTQATADGTVLRVQVKVGLRRVPAYDDRADETLADLPYDWIELGWREARPGNQEAQQAFDDYVGR